MNPKNDPLNAIFFTPTEEQKRELHRKRAASVILRLDADVRTELQEYIYFEKLSAAERAAKAMRQAAFNICKRYADAERSTGRTTGDWLPDDLACMIRDLDAAAIARQAMEESRT